MQIASVQQIADGDTQLTMNASTAPVYGFLVPARFYATNLFSELDAENEYYIDTIANRLFFMPPGGDPTGAEAVLSVVNYGVASTSADASGRVPFKRAREMVLDSAVHEARAAGEAGVLSFVNIVGIDIHYARIAGIALAAAANVVISDLDSSNHGHNGVTLFGTNIQVARIEASGTGCEASSLYGGDTSSLVPGNSSLTDSSFTNYARTIRTYNPGVGIGGVGNTYARNHISVAPHTGMTGGGVLLSVLENTFDTLCYEATDSGAFYIGRSWTNRGVVVRGNTFVNVRNREHMTLGYGAVQAIYLDDEQSGTSLIDNVCIDSQTCFFVGGGRDTIVQGNTCVGDVDTCVHVDNRGLNWQRDSCTYNASYTGDLVQGLFNVKYQQAPYATAFPEIVSTLERRPCTPTNISIVANRYCANSTKQFLDMSVADLTSYGDFVSGNEAIAC